MDWRHISFDWNHARAFLATAEIGSLSAAARAMGLTQPTLSRQVEALEQALGVVLFERVGRGLMLTPSGLDLLEHVRGMGEAAERLALAATGRSETIEGGITLTTSEVYAAYLLPPILQKLRAAHPAISIEVLASNRPSDLTRREADIAIRNFASKDPDLIVKRLSDDRARLYASKSYTRALGKAHAPADLADADFIGFIDLDVLLDGLNALGFALTRRNFAITCNSHLAQWAMVKQGIGVITEVVGDAEPDIVRVLPEMAPIEFPRWLAVHRELHTSRRVRTVFDFLAAELAQG
jgi:DNA-binding transcriptional LysR family regulator